MKNEIKAEKALCLIAF